MTVGDTRVKTKTSIRTAVNLRKWLIILQWCVLTLAFKGSPVCSGPRHHCVSCGNLVWLLHHYVWETIGKQISPDILSSWRDSRQETQTESPYDITLTLHEKKNLCFFTDSIFFFFSFFNFWYQQLTLTKLSAPLCNITKMEEAGSRLLNISCSNG